MLPLRGGTEPKSNRLAEIVKSSTADSEHTPHPFLLTLEPKFVCQAEAWSQFFCNLRLASFPIIYHALNTNPQSVSSYSLRVLKSLHKIFRAPFLIIGLKILPKQFTCVAKTLSKNTRVKRVFSKTLPTTKNSFLQVTTVCGLPKQVQAQLGPSPTQEKHAPTSFLPLLPLQHNYLTVSKLPSATKLHYSVPTTNNSRAHLKNKRVGKNMHFTTELQGQSKAFYTFLLEARGDP